MVRVQVSRELNVLEAGSQFISNNFYEWSEKYKEKFIAVRDNELICVGDNFEEVMETLRSKGINPSSVLVEYVPSQEEILAI